MKNFEEYRNRSDLSCKCERSFEWRRWLHEIPAIAFPSQWKIRVIPPFGGAIARFVVVSEFGEISVYLDAYDQLGCMDMKPYWEIHPSEDGDCERYAMNDIEGLLAGLHRAVNALKPKDVL